MRGFWGWGSRSAKDRMTKMIMGNFGAAVNSQDRMYPLKHPPPHPPLCPYAWYALLWTFLQRISADGDKEKGKKRIPDKDIFNRLRLTGTKTGVNAVYPHTVKICKVIIGNIQLKIICILWIKIFQWKWRLFGMEEFGICWLWVSDMQICVPKVAVLTKVTIGFA